jgi:hypothetical protein
VKGISFLKITNKCNKMPLGERAAPLRGGLISFNEFPLAETTPIDGRKNGMGNEEEAPNPESWGRTLKWGLANTELGSD